MTKNEKRNEQKFLDALKAVFVGAKVEGESGYINLMKIKASYFENGVFPQLSKDIDAACKPFPKEFREELFDKLFDFFSRYFSESGSIYFRHTAPHQSVYEKVYTDDQDVMLFWKTHMLYYVKTDRLFNSMEVEVNGNKFYFDVTGMQLKKSNEKRDLVYSFKEVAAGIVYLKVNYSERGKKTKIEDLEKEVKKKGITLEPDILEKAFRVFEKQSEVDFFINKNAKAFLEEQFDLWLYQYMFKGESQFTESRLKQLQTIKGIAFKIIEFIAQFEDELVKIWNKPKFVLNSHYVITIDKISDSALLEKIIQHTGMPAQVQEWKDLGMIPDDFQVKWITQKDLTDVPLYAQYQQLPIDTKHFSDLEQEVLALFDDLDATLDGRVIHSENYQALITLMPKYQDRIRSIYIDPPYNSKSTEILYVNTYKHSSWLSMMENRLKISKRFSTIDGSHVIAIDENEQEELGLLLAEVFPNHTKTCISVIHNKKGIQGDYFSYNNDFAYFCLPSALGEINGKPIPEEEWEYVSLRKWGTESTRDTAKNCFYPIYVKDNEIIGFGDVCQEDFHPDASNIKRKDGVIEIYPIDKSGVERKWRFARNSVEGILALLKVVETQDGEKQIVKARNYQQYKTVWDSSLYIAGDYGTRLLTDMGIFPDENLYPKSVHVVSDAIHAISEKSSIILDYFAGSGTTAHAVMQLNKQDGGKRKYILVELGEHFNTVILPRIKKVAFSDQWRDGKANNGKGTSQFVKYFDLEQYEDTLRRAKYEDANLFTGTESAYSSYPFLKDLKMLDSVEIDRANNEVHVDLNALYPGIDLAETLSCLTGKWIKRITSDFVEFDDGTTASLTKPRWEDVKPLIWW